MRDSFLKIQSEGAGANAEETKDDNNLLGEITVGLKNQPSPRPEEGDTVDSTPTPTNDEQPEQQM